MPSSNNSPSIDTRGWMLSLTLLIATFTAAFFPVWTILIRQWIRSEEYSHGFLIVPLSVYIAWTKRKELSRAKLNQSWQGLVLAGIALLLYIFAFFSEINTAMSLSMLIFVVGAVLYSLGWQALNTLKFPLFLLLLMVPIPAQIYSELTVPLQLIVSQISTMAAKALAVPIYREGNVIHLQDRTLAVVQACSGMHSLISLSTLALVFGFFTLRTVVSRSALVFSSVPVAMLVNIVRVWLIVVAFHFFDFDLTSDSIHGAFGAAIFILALVLMVGVQWVMAKCENRFPNAF